MRVNFQEVAIHAEKSVKCAKGCGRRLKRRQKFSQTINPFNKRADGQVKTPHDIRLELNARAEEWKASPEVCCHCAKEEQGK